MSYDTRRITLDPNLTFHALRGLQDREAHRPFLWPEIRRRQRAERRATKWRRRWERLREVLGSAVVLVVTLGLVLGAVWLIGWRE